MKKVLLSLISVLVLAGNALAADTTTTPKGWLDDLELAKKQAAETGRPILVLFTGSDWCPPCMALKKNVFEKSDFKEYAAGNLVLLYIDTPRSVQLPPERTAANKKVKAAYGIRAFPTVLLLNSEAEKIGKVEDRSLTKFMNSIKKAVKDYRQNQAKTPAAKQ